MDEKPCYLLSVRFKDMGPDDSLYLTDSGQPFEVAEGDVDHYANQLKEGKGFLGDFEDSITSGEWVVEQVFATKLGPRTPR